ncbi:hypothetical protein HA402_008070 [Bradysia odoriphaga]|nr:hypothetical protein HA402_008070 [Bradysia odoriphaga]
MQHFVVDQIKEETDTSVDAALSQSSVHSIEQEPLQRHGTADSTKSIDSTLSAEEPVERPLSADEINVRSLMDLQDNGIANVERYGHCSPSPMDVDSFRVIIEESQSHLETAGDVVISSELTTSSPQGVDCQQIGGSDVSEKDLSQMLEMETRTKSELKHLHPNVREECPSPATTIIKDEFRDEHLKSTETVISKGLEDECLSSSTITKSRSDDVRPTRVIIESEPVDECPSPTRTIIKSELEVECPSPDRIDTTSKSDAECPSPAVTIIKYESDDECSRPTRPIKTENGAADLRLTERQSPDRIITISDSDYECPSPAETILKNEFEDEGSRATSPIKTENGAADLKLRERQSFNQCLSPTKTIMKSESEDECPSPAATIIKSESEDEFSRPTSPVNAENVSSCMFPATEVVQNDSQDIFVDSKLGRDQSSSRSFLDNSLDRRESSSSQQHCGVDRHHKSFTKRQQTSNERCAATNSPSSSSKALYPSSFLHRRRTARTVRGLHNESEFDKSFRNETSESKPIYESERVRLQRPNFERYLSKLPSSNERKRIGCRWSDIRFTVTPERNCMEIDTTDDSEPDYGWEDPPPPKRVCVETKSTRELDPNIHEQMQIFMGKLSSEFDLDVIEESRKKLFKAIDESIAVQSTKKLSELDQKIQKKKDDYLLNLFGTDEFKAWDNDPALGNV